MPGGRNLECEERIEDLWTKAIASHNHLVRSAARTPCRNVVDCSTALSKCIGTARPSGEGVPSDQITILLLCPFCAVPPARFLGMPHQRRTRNERRPCGQQRRRG